LAATSSASAWGIASWPRVTQLRQLGDIRPLTAGGKRRGARPLIRYGGLISCDVGNRHGPSMIAMYSAGSKLRRYQCHYFSKQTSTKVRKKRRRVSIPILLLDLLLLLSVWRLPSCLPA